MSIMSFLFSEDQIQTNVLALDSLLQSSVTHM